jgi:hypothetical protein
MAYPTDSARTKTWGTEVLTAADQHAQLDLLHAWVNAAMNGTSGHGHTGGTNDGKQIVLTTAVTGTLPATNGGTGTATVTQGDVLYGSAANVWSKLGAGTAGQALTTGGAGANPAFAGMTTQGDVEYHNGTTRTRLAPGTAGQVLKTLGAGANPVWVNALSSVLDYGTSASTSTSRQATALKIASGQFAFSANGSQAITNLGFSSSSSYAVVTNSGYAVTTNENIRVSYDSGSQFTLYNDINRACTVGWIAIGT